MKHSTQLQTAFIAFTMVRIMYITIFAGITDVPFGHLAFMAVGLGVIAEFVKE